MGDGASFPGVEAADHLPPTSAEVKKTWVYASTPQDVIIV
jgi:hypothetical protein